MFNENNVEKVATKIEENMFHVSNNPNKDITNTIGINLNNNNNSQTESIIDTNIINKGDSNFVTPCLNSVGIDTIENNKKEEDSKNGHDNTISVTNNGTTYKIGNDYEYLDINEICDPDGSSSGDDQDIVFNELTNVTVQLVTIDNSQFGKVYDINTTERIVLFNISELDKTEFLDIIQLAICLWPYEDLKLVSEVITQLFNFYMKDKDVEKIKSQVLKNGDEILKGIYNFHIIYPDLLDKRCSIQLDDCCSFYLGININNQN